MSTIPVIHEHGTATISEDAAQKMQAGLAISIARSIKSHVTAMNFHAHQAEQKEAQLNGLIDLLPEEWKSVIEGVLDGEPTMLLDELERTVRA